MPPPHHDDVTITCGFRTTGVASIGRDGQAEIYREVSKPPPKKKHDVALKRCARRSTPPESNERFRPKTHRVNGHASPYLRSPTREIDGQQVWSEFLEGARRRMVRADGPSRLTVIEIGVRRGRL